jgi:hypothetical protein
MIFKVYFGHSGTSVVDWFLVESGSMFDAIRKANRIARKTHAAHIIAVRAELIGELNQ